MSRESKSISFDADTVVSVRPPSRKAGIHAGRVLSGRYKLIRPLGSGGMGEVYEAEHLTLGTAFAVKTMHEHIAAQPDYVRRFGREARAASMLDHPNVVRVIDFGEDAGIFYIVMEYLRGRSLGEWIARLPEPPPLKEVEDILLQTLDGLERAHDHGIVHRDLKVENIFLTEIAGKRVVKVLDFGLAHVDDPRDMGPTLTNPESVGGTPEYMSPEQCRSLAVGPSADLYSLGCVLTTLLQQSPPFLGESAVDVISKHMFLPPPPLQRPSSAEPVPPLLERLRLTLLAKSPERRPSDAAEVRARLVEAMSEEASAERLPPRKSGEPMGSRADRALDWGGPGASKNTETLPTQAAHTRPVDATAMVGLFRGGDGDGGKGGVDSICMTGVAAHGIALAEAPDLEELAAASYPLVVLDMGADFDGAREALGRVVKSDGGPRVIVCVERPGIEKMNALIAAGAADVVTYPVSADTLARKIARLLRRKRG